MNATTPITSSQTAGAESTSAPDVTASASDLFAGAGPFPPEILKVWNYDLNLPEQDDDDDDWDDDECITPMEVYFQDQYRNVFHLINDGTGPRMGQSQLPADRDETPNAVWNKATSEAHWSFSKIKRQGTTELPVIALDPRLVLRGENALYAMGGCRSARACDVAVIGEDGWRIVRAPGPMFYSRFNRCDDGERGNHDYYPTKYTDLSEEFLRHANERGLRPLINRLLTSPFRRFRRETGESRITLIQQQTDQGRQLPFTVASRIEGTIEDGSPGCETGGKLLFKAAVPEEIARRAVLYIDARHPVSAAELLKGWNRFVAAIDSLDDSVPTRVLIDWDSRHEPPEAMLKTAHIIKLQTPENPRDAWGFCSDWFDGETGPLLTQIFQAVVADYARTKS